MWFSCKVWKSIKILFENGLSSSFNSMVEIEKSKCIWVLKYIKYYKSTSFETQKVLS